MFIKLTVPQYTAKGSLKSTHHIYLRSEDIEAVEETKPTLVVLKNRTTYNVLESSSSIIEKSIRAEAAFLKDITNVE